MPAANGSVQLRALSARLKAAGARDVKLSMTRQLRLAARDVVAGLQDEARDVLPKAGGLNEFVAAQKPKVSVRTTGRQAGVSVRSKVPGNYTNTGRWRHPVFSADRTRWAKDAQSYPQAAGWWERGAARATPRAQVEMRVILSEVALEIQRLGI